MSYYGIQSNGMVRLSNGNLWDPNTGLPPEDAASFNSTPNGNPLIPSSLPRMQSAPAAAMPTSSPSAFGGSALATQPSSGDMSSSGSWLDSILKANSLPTSADLQRTPTAPTGMFGAQPTTAAKPSFFGEGGTGRTIAGIIGDALLAANNRPMIYAPLREKQMEFQKTAYQQQQEGLRQLMVAQFNRANPEPTVLQRNHDYLVSIGRPDLADTYLRAESNPMTLMTDPTTGALGFGPKAGVQPSGPPAAAVAALKADPTLRSQFDQKYGAGSAAQILGN